MIRGLDAAKPITVLLDFDGVIHDYSAGWNGPKPTGRLLHGVTDALRMLHGNGAVVEIFSTRPKVEILEFLRVNGLDKYIAEVRDGKPYYVAFFDDRAFHVAPSEDGGLLRSVGKWLEAQERRE